jgi:hypothetical protein
MADEVRIDTLSLRVPGAGSNTSSRVADGLSRALASAAPQLRGGTVDSLQLRVELGADHSEAALIEALGRAVTRALSE